MSSCSSPVQQPLFVLHLCFVESQCTGTNLGRGRAASGSIVAALSSFSWCQKHPIPHRFSSGRCICGGNPAGKSYMGGPSYHCKEISLAKKAIINLIIVKSKTFRFTYLYFLAFSNMPHHIPVIFPLAPYLKSLYIVCLSTDWRQSPHVREIISSFQHINVKVLRASE